MFEIYIELPMYIIPFKYYFHVNISSYAIIFSYALHNIYYMYIYNPLKFWIVATEEIVQFKDG